MSIVLLSNSSVIFLFHSRLPISVGSFLKNKMDDKELNNMKILAELLKQPSQKPNDFLGQNINKILVTIIGGGIIWMLSSINTQSKKQTADDVANKYKQQEIELMNNRVRDLEDKMQKPRFTIEDYNSNTAPLINGLNSNTARINEQGLKISTVNERLLKIEYKTGIKQ